MTRWFRQHRESIAFRTPCHLPGETRASTSSLGLFAAVCATSVAVQDHWIDSDGRRADHAEVGEGGRAGLS